MKNRYISSLPSNFTENNQSLIGGIYWMAKVKDY